MWWVEQFMTARYCWWSVRTGVAAKHRWLLGIVDWNGTVQLLKIFWMRLDLWNFGVLDERSCQNDQLIYHAASSWVNSKPLPSWTLFDSLWVTHLMCSDSSVLHLKCQLRDLSHVSFPLSSSSPSRCLTRTHHPVPQSTLLSWQRGKPRAFAILYATFLD